MSNSELRALYARAFGDKPKPRRSIQQRMFAVAAAATMASFGITPAMATNYSGTITTPDPVVIANGDSTSGAIFDVGMDFVTVSNSNLFMSGANQVNGTATLNTSDGFEFNYGASLDVSSTGTVQGNGYLYQYGSGGVLTNEGTINANSSGSALNIQSLNSVTNSNLMEATNSGTLNFSSTTLNNNAAITANGGTVIINSSNYNGVVGSSLNQTSGLLELNNSTLNGVVAVTGTTGLTLDNSDVLNTGTVTGNLDFATVNNANLFLQGANTYNNGTINLASSDGLEFDYAASLDLGSASTVQGYGYIYQYGNGGTLTNEGTVNANANGNTLTIENLPSVTNNNLFEATNGGALALSSNYLVNNGAITANGGSVGLYSDTYIGHSGSTLNQTSGSLVDNNSTLGDGTVADGYVTVTGSTGLTIVNGDVVNEGTITGNLDFATNGNSNLFLQNTNTYNNGTINLATSDGLQWDYAAALDLGSGSTVKGYGNLFQYGSGGSLTNEGVIDATNATSALNITSLTSVTNNNLFEADGGTLELNGTNVSNAGTITAKNGGSVQLNTINYTGTTGTLNQVGTGQILENNSTLYGNITVDGATGLTFNSAGNNVLNNDTITGNLDFATYNNAYAILEGANTYDNGTINMATSSGLQFDYTASLDNGSTGTIQGYGYLYQYGSGGTLTNEGTVIANSNGNALNISNLAGVTNNNIFEASNGGTLNYNNDATYNDAGSITAGNGSTVVLNNGSYTGNGGTIGQVGTGLAVENGATLYGSITTTGATGLTFNSNGSNVLSNDTITGNVDFATYNNAYAFLSGANTYDHGTLNLATSSGIQFNYTASLTNGSGGTIQGHGYLQQYGSGGTFVNNGTVNANSTGNGLNIINLSTVTNNGTFEATHGGLLAVNTNVTTNGFVYVDSSSQFNAGQLNQYAGTATVDGVLNVNQGSGTFDVLGGTLNGTGTVQGNVLIGTNGTVSPGDAPGTLTVTQAYEQAGIWNESLSSPTTFGAIDAGTSFSLDAGSTIDVFLLNGFTPTLGETFNIASYSSLLTNDATVFGNNGWEYLFQDNGSGHVGELVVTQVGVAATPETNSYIIFALMMAFGGAVVVVRRRSLKV